MLLIDSLYINNSGGKILLDYLVETLEKNKIKTYYLFDDRCSSEYEFIPKNRKVFVKANLLNRHKFYKRKKDKFKKVLCFGNLAPSIQLDIPVFTYFHQPLFLEVPQSLSLLHKVKFKLKTIILDSIKSNTNIWLVQSENIRKSLVSKYKIKKSHVKLMPFYPPLNSEKNYDRRKDGFVYISNGGPHKNHNNLIDAFCNYYDKTSNGTLHLTINDDFLELKTIIQTKIDEGYPIVNHGFIERHELVKIYNSNHYLIFPSLAESFGLGLVEAIENGCKVIGADLPYTYAVCNPSIVFNPLDVEDIEKALIQSQLDQVKETEQLVFNQIDELIKLLTQ